MRTDVRDTLRRALRIVPLHLNPIVGAVTDPVQFSAVVEVAPAVARFQWHGAAELSSTIRTVMKRVRTSVAVACCFAVVIHGAASFAQTRPVTSGAPTAAAPCPAGQERSAETGNRCCWPNQVWGGDRCRGIPSRCPPGFAVNAAREMCGLDACPPGRARAQDGVTCCWPGQVAASRTCRGVPSSCPAGLVVSAESCVQSAPATDAAATSTPAGAATTSTAVVPAGNIGATSGAEPNANAPPAATAPFADPSGALPVNGVCPPGQSVSDVSNGHCCWGVQAWSAAQNACIGIPTCPPGLVPQGDNCAAPPPPALSGATNDAGSAAAPRPPTTDWPPTRIASVALMGGGGLVFAIGTGLFFAAVFARPTPPPGMSSTGGLLAAGITMEILGGTAAGVGLVLFFTSQPRPAATQSQAMLIPSVTSDGASLSLFSAF